MPITLDLSDKTALITGGTRGIGAAVAATFERAGARLILTGTDPDNVDRKNREAEAAGRSHVRYVAADFSQHSGIDAFVDGLADLPRIDICVNNAGVNRIKPVHDTRAEDFDLLTSVNLRAPYLISREVSRSMVEQRWGRIINIASIWSVITKPGRSTYTTTKFGLVGMTKTLAAELAHHGVLVNAVSPGFTMTELTRASLSDEEAEDLARQVPINRFAQPEEIARVVLFLASELNTYITGQNIVVDGGFTSV